jgi:hypothetical protein
MKSKYQSAFFMRRSRYRDWLAISGCALCVKNRRLTSAQGGLDNVDNRFPKALASCQPLLGGFGFVCLFVSKGAPRPGAAGNFGNEADAALRIGYGPRAMTVAEAALAGAGGPSGLWHRVAQFESKAPAVAFEDGTVDYFLR